tara:strand:- start:63 stop:434 length:372 start_codon:yes stop_codon:yes gene_type:complete
MKIVHHLLIVIVTLLSVAAGIAKVMQSPQEVQFLQRFAFNDFAITCYGVMQILAAVVLIIGALIYDDRAKLTGAIAISIGFLLSSVLIFVSGNWAFGLMSLLPIILTGMIIKQVGKFSKNINR